MWLSDIIYGEQRLEEASWLRKALFLDGRRDVTSGVERVEWSGVHCEKMHVLLPISLKMLYGSHMFVGC